MADEVHEVELKDGSTLQIVHFSKEATPLIRKIKEQAIEEQLNSQGSPKPKKSKKRKRHHEANLSAPDTALPAKLSSQPDEESEIVQAETHEPWSYTPTAKISHTAPGSDQYLSSPIKSRLPKSEGGPVSTSSPPPAITIIRPHSPPLSVDAQSSSHTAPSIPGQVFLLSQVPILQPLETPISSVFAHSDVAEQPEREIIACYASKQSANEAAVTACLTYATDRGIEQQHARWRDAYDKNGCLRLVSGWSLDMGPGVEITVEQVAFILDTPRNTEGVQQDRRVVKVKVEEQNSSALNFDFNFSNIEDFGLRTGNELNHVKPQLYKRSSSAGPVVTTANSDIYETNADSSHDHNAAKSLDAEKQVDKESGLPSEARDTITPATKHAHRASSTGVSLSKLKSRITNNDGHVSGDGDDTHSERGEHSKDLDHSQPGLYLEKAATIHLPSSLPHTKHQTAAESHDRIPSSVERAQWQASKRRRIDKEPAKTVDASVPDDKNQHETMNAIQNLWPVPSSTTTPQRKLIFKDVSIPRSNTKHRGPRTQVSEPDAPASKSIKRPAVIDLTLDTPPQQSAALPTLAKGGLRHPSKIITMAPSSDGTSTSAKKSRASRRKAARKENRLRGSGQREREETPRANRPDKARGKSKSRMSRPGVKRETSVEFV